MPTVVDRRYLYLVRNRQIYYGSARYFSTHEELAVGRGLDPVVRPEEYGNFITVVPGTQTVRLESKSQAVPPRAAIVKLMKRFPQYSVDVYSKGEGDTKEMILSSWKKFEVTIKDGVAKLNGKPLALADDQCELRVHLMDKVRGVMIDKWFANWDQRELADSFNAELPSGQNLVLAIGYTNIDEAVKTATEDGPSRWYQGNQSLFQFQSVAADPSNNGFLSYNSWSGSNTARLILGEVYVGDELVMWVSSYVSVDGVNSPDGALPLSQIKDLRFVSYFRMTELAGF